MVNGFSGSGTVDNTSTNPAALSIGNANVSSTFAGIIQNTGTNLALIKIGTGTLELDEASTFTGGVTISNGVVLIGPAVEPVPGLFDPDEQSICEMRKLIGHSSPARWHYRGFTRK